MLSKNIKLIAMVIVIALIVIGGYFIYQKMNPNQNEEPSSLDVFAQCLSEKGLKFYGTYWCPACKSQKELFGSSMKYINYIECTEETEECNRAGIEQIPTWEISDGNREVGLKTLEQLSEKSGCQLP